MSTYEQLRKKNLADNRRVLADLGLGNPFKPLGRVVKKGKKFKAPVDNSPRAKPKVEDLSNCGSIHGVRRRSARILGSPVGSGDEWRIQDDDEDEENTPRKAYLKRPNSYGPIVGVEVGTVWMMRIQCSRDGIHRPTVAGIHGGPDGAYSIALSGGYDDNIDLGDCFTYTGEGGRDLKGTSQNPKNLRTAPQSKDQTLSRGNLALSESIKTGNPVRVIRGYKLQSFSPFAPDEGYRYDGLYTVEKSWFTTGLSGFGVWKFALRRSTDQAPPPWDVIQSENSPNKESRKIDIEDEEGEDCEDIAMGRKCELIVENNNNCVEKGEKMMDESEHDIDNDVQSTGA